MSAGVMLRVWTREADAAYGAVHFRYFVQNGGEIVIPVFVGVHRLPEERHSETPLRRVPGLRGERPVHPCIFGPAHGRHDAVTAVLVAAALDGDVGAERVRVHRGEPRIVFVCVKFSEDARGAVPF